MKATSKTDQEKLIFDKIRTLSPEKMVEVLDFVDFLHQKDLDHQMLIASAKLSEDSFRKIWDNPEDDVYDRL